MQEDQDYVSQWVAFEGYVELRAWIETSSNGFKVQLTLPSREDLEYFDGVMARRKGVGGHRYKIIATSDDAFGTRVMDCQFWGRGWSETKGTHIALHFIDNDVTFWKSLKTRDQGDSEIPGERFYVVLMEYADDDTIVNQSLLQKLSARAEAGLEQGTLADARERAEDAGADMPKGGPRSQNAAKLLKEQGFLDWLNQHEQHKKAGPFSTYEDAHAYVLARIDMKSFRQFDVNELFWSNFEIVFKKPYIASQADY
jgi:hypothetical protein